MKRISLVALLALATYSFALPKPPSKIHFNNGDTLTGNVLSVDRNQLTWNSELLGSETKLNISKIREIVFTNESQVTADGDHIAYVKCNQDLRQKNQKLPGDTFHGKLIDITPKHLVLETWYAGRLEIDRNMIASLEISDNQSIIYAGPKSVNDWSFFPSKSWANLNGKLVQKTDNAIAERTFETLPDNFRLSFNAEWDHQVSLNIEFCTHPRQENRVQDGYHLMLDPHYCYLQRRAKSKTEMVQGNDHNAQILRQKTQSILELYVSRKLGKIALFSDNKLIYEWLDSAPKLNGKSIRLSSTTRANIVTVSQFVIHQWDGILPNTEQTRDSIINPDPQEGEQRMYLRNGDIALGRYKKIDAGKISLTTRYGDLDLPISRMKKMDIPSPEYNERLLQNGDIRCWFPDGNFITFRLDAITEEGTFKGSAQHFGEAIFHPQAFSRIEFNLYPAYPKDL